MTHRSDPVYKGAGRATYPPSPLYGRIRENVIDPDYCRACDCVGCSGCNYGRPREVVRDHEAEQAEREQFHTWFINAFKYPPFDYGAPTDSVAGMAWAAWRARAIL